MPSNSFGVTVISTKNFIHFIRTSHILQKPLHKWWAEHTALFRCLNHMRIYSRQLRLLQLLGWRMELQKNIRTEISNWRESCQSAFIKTIRWLGGNEAAAQFDLNIRSDNLLFIQIVIDEPTFTYGSLSSRVSPWQVILIKDVQHQRKWRVNHERSTHTQLS